MFDDLTTAELKSYIRENDTNQEVAAMELCLREDSGDLASFFATLRFQPKDGTAFILEARERGVPYKALAAATGKTERALESVVYDQKRPRRLNGTGRPYQRGRPPKTDVNWEQAEDMATAGMSFRQIGQELGVDEARLRNDLGVRTARADGDPTFSARLTERHYDRSSACNLEPAEELIHDIKMMLRRLMSPVYTLGDKDKATLTQILTDAYKELTV